MRGHKGTRRGIPAGTGLQLLPLLDLLFATIGILIVVMLIQQTASVDVGHPYATDAVLACDGRASATLYSGPDASPLRVELTTETLTEALADIAKKARVNVLVGVAAACASRYSLFERVAKRLAVKRGQLFRFTYVPAEPPEEVLERILRKWRGESEDGR